MNLTKIFASLSLCCISFLTYAAPLNTNNLPDFMRSQGYVVVPFEKQLVKDQKFIVLHAKLCYKNACIKRNLVMDLGDPDAHLSPSLAKQLNVNFNQHKILLSQVCLSNKCLKKIRAYLGKKGDHTPSHLGLDFFRKLQAIVDLKNEKVYIPTRKSSEYLTKYIKEKNTYREIPIVFFEGYIVFTVQLNQLPPKKFLFDTGAITMINNAYAKKYNIKIQKDKCFTGYGQPGTLKICQIKQDQIISMKINGFNSHFIPKSIYTTDLSFVLPSENTQGIIGLEWMYGNQVLIDLQNNVLWM